MQRGREPEPTAAAAPDSAMKRVGLASLWVRVCMAMI